MAQQLVHGASPAEVAEIISAENLLQKRSPEATRTVTSYLLQRLEGLPVSLVEIVAEGTNREATQATFIAALAHSLLLRSFVSEAIAGIRAERRGFVSVSDWASFLDWLEGQDPSTTRWTPVVRAKLRQNIWRILAEAEVTDSTKSMKLQAVRLEPRVRECLEDSSLSEVASALAAGGFE